MTRRRAGLVAAGLVVAISAAGLAATLLRRSPTPTAASGPPRFADETETSGLVHAYGGDAVAAEFQVGGGVAVFDCDGDGLDDVYIAGGEGPAALFVNASTISGTLRFERLAAGATDLSDVNGAYPIDLEGDGRIDLAVLRSGASTLLRNDGSCRFEAADTGLVFDGVPGQTIAFSATWEAESSLPTLAFGRYLVGDEPGTFNCDDGTLLRGAPGGATYGPPILLSPGYCALSMLFSDWDRSGRRDLRVTNDRQYYTDGMDQLWRIAPGETPRAYTSDDGWVAMQIWGMGIASHDLTGDGYPEVYLTSQGDNKLQTLTAGPDKPTFRDIALRRGVTVAQPYAGGERLPSTAWHPEFDDVNNDGFLDLFVSKGNVGDQEGYALRDPSNLLIGQPDGTFAEGAMAAEVMSFDRGRGAALTDFNRDGLLDLLLVNYNADVRLWRNVGSGTADDPAPMGHWLQIDVNQAGPNRNAIGAWLEARIGDLTITRELTIGGGHAGGQLGWMHLGLGPTSSAEVRIVWPDGDLGPWQRLEADAHWILERGAAPVRWSPVRE